MNAGADSAMMEATESLITKSPPSPGYTYRERLKNGRRTTAPYPGGA